MKIELATEGRGRKTRFMVELRCVGEAGLKRCLEELTVSCGTGLARQARREAFTAKSGEVLVWRDGDGRVTQLLVGTGAVAVDPAKWRQAIIRGLTLAARHRIPALALVLPGSAAVDDVRAAATAAGLAGYRFDRHKTKTRSATMPGLFVVRVPDARSREAARGALAFGAAEAEAVTLARDLVNEPANLLSPPELVNRARRLAQDRGLSCTVLGERQLRAKGLGLLLAVAQGSPPDRRPALIHLGYRPRGAGLKIAIVGKGLTFDSGGLCLKDPKPMADMKSDMAGAAVVLATMSLLKEAGVAVEVHGVIPATDNLIGPAAIRPGDVVTSASGQTVEITNTDAEGRLILADAITFAQGLSPDIIITHATLTGACVVALGPQMAGLFASDDELASSYLDAATRAGEPFWRLPLAEGLARDLASDVADLRNSGGRFGGAILGALFLQRFVGTTRFIHCDIAGPAYAESAQPGQPKGGTGFGVLTLVEFLRRLA